MSFRFDSTQWALILGGSSGFGLATAKKLALEGMSICIVHRDRRGSMPRIEDDFAILRNAAPEFLALNTDALSPDGIALVTGVLKDKLGAKGRVAVLVHSIAYGNLKPLELLEEEDLSRTIHSMGTSLLTWTKELKALGLFDADARVIGLTSEGNEIAWRGYAAVSAAKCALEAMSRAIALEFGPCGIRSNIIQAGITDTPALRLIPGSEKMKASALARNPLKRLTTPEDVGNAIYLLCRPEAAWINGALLRVDGGEHIGSE